FQSIPAVTGEDPLRFYAGQPLRAPGGERVGSLCILDTKPHSIDAGDLGLLRDLADLVEKELAMSAELSQAAEVQRQLLPKAPPTVPGYQIAGRCVPAAEVGGDFFDWYTLDDGTPQITLADVMGKGVPAALIAASVRAILRGGSLHNELEAAVNKSAHGMESDLDETGRFVTLFTARIDQATGTVTYVDAGHGLSIILDTSGGHRELISDGLPLGAVAGDRWQSHTALLAPGETLMSVSDGFLDFYDTTANAIAGAIRATAETVTAQQLVDRMVAFSARHLPTDDLTVVIVRRDAE
ncbi:MAG TPA: SpoIIE family protein phosphatase, partial [Jiangellaceae bacterium]|nr:SpoIIE family protein phosphatase [Jiangellaceae bacterium]